MELNSVINSLKKRFGSTHTDLKILDEFFGLNQMNKIKDYFKLCRLGNTVVESKMLNYKAVMDIIVAKAPSSLKAFLFDFSCKCQEWSEFLRRAEEMAWIAFPIKEDKTELILEPVNTNNFKEYKNKTNINETSRHAPQDEKKFIVSNKMINSCLKNPCFVQLKFGDEYYRALIDTGADVSIIPCHVIKKSNIQLYDSSMRINSACGNALDIMGRINKIDFLIGGARISTSAYVTRNKPEYIILGIDAITKQPAILEYLVKKLISPDKSKSLVNRVNYISIEEKYHDMFKTEISEMTLCNRGKHEIETTSDKPVYQKNYKIPIHFEKEISDQIQKNLELGVIRNSKSPWNSRIVPITKPDGSLRMCIDYRELNKVTIKDKYPLPRIDEILDDLSEACIFSTLDATSGYYQIAMDEKDKEKTAFSWRGGHYEFNRMPFGLCNAPATFQRTMDSIFVKENRKFVIPYLDDIIVYSKNHQEHREHLEIVFGRLKAANIALNKKKCHFFKDEIKILGSIVTKDSIKPDPEKVSAISNYEEPKNVSALRSFLGLVNYCREFIPNLSSLAAPLNEFLKGESKRSIKKITLGTKGREAFKILKQQLTINTLRYKPDFKKPFILTTDASENGIGAILTQIGENDKERFVSAFSKSLEKAHKNYSTTDKELLAVVKSIDHYRNYLLGKEFTLKTDHKSLTYLWETKNPTSRILRWAMKLQEYSFVPTYIEGEKNGADGLSRQGSETININSVEAEEFSPEVKLKILQSYHVESGHGSSNTMKFMIAKRYKWKSLNKDIEDFVSKCQTCLKSGYPLRNTKNKVIQSDRPNELWEIDLIGRIADSSGGNCFIFIAVDHYSKWVETKVINYKTGTAIVDAIQEKILDKHGIPARILTDNGLEFCNKEVKALADRNGISWGYSSPEHHQTVGAVERANQSLMNILKKVTEFGETSWKRQLDNATRCLNYAFNRSIGTSPYILKHNKLPTLPVDEELNQQDVTFSAEQLSKSRDDNFEKYKKAIVKGQVEITKRLNIDDKVLIYKENPVGKFSCNWESGYTITDIILPDAYLVKKNNKIYRLNKSRVKLDSSI
ncbi:MAG: reverse transcriptase domain-containing protein [Clostridium sp.]